MIDVGVGIVGEVVVTIAVGGKAVVVTNKVGIVSKAITTRS